MTLLSKRAMKDKRTVKQPKKQAVSVPTDSLEQKSKRFTQLFSELVPDLNVSIKALVYDTNNVKEILQNVAVILWEKYKDVSDKTEFRKVAYTVLRYELLAYRRDKARDRLVFDENVIALIVDHSSIEEPEISREQELMEQFIAAMNAEDRELLFSAYQSQTKIKDIAEKWGKTPMSLYKRLQRIRAELIEFVTKELKKNLYE